MFASIQVHQEKILSFSNIFLYFELIRPSNLLRFFHIFEKKIILHFIRRIHFHILINVEWFPISTTKKKNLIASICGWSINTKLKCENEPPW